MFDFLPTGEKALLGMPEAVENQHAFAEIVLET